MTYTNASASKPSDSFPGLIAMVTGGSPVSTGIWYDASYDRNLFAPGSNCTGTPGTAVTYAENVDFDVTQIDGGAAAHGGLAINPNNLPRDLTRGCAPLYPHSYLRVNTIFEVAKAAGLRTAWCDKHPAYELVNGPSGTGVDDLFTPEINSNINSVTPTPPCTGTIWTDSVCAVEFYDTLKVRAILHEIEGFDHTGTNKTRVPAIFGTNFQSVSVAQKLAIDPMGATGYADVNGTPNPALANAIAFVDDSIGKMVQELRKEDLFDSTLVIVSAKHGQSPIDLNKVNNTDRVINGCNPPPSTPTQEGAGCRLDDSLYSSLVTGPGQSDRRRYRSSLAESSKPDTGEGLCGNS